jgi:hypothetical protein
MRLSVGTKIGLGCNAMLIGIIGIVTWNHIETHRAEWERDQRLRAICEAPGFIPADIRCIIVKFVKHNPPALIAAVAYQESRFRNDVCSPVKACGLMQFMPGTATLYNVEVKDALSSIKGGDAYLRDLTKQFGNAGLALAAYNWGPGNLSCWLGRSRNCKRKPMPAETREYVKAITGHPVEAWLGKATPKLGGHHLRMVAHLNPGG